MGFLDKAKAFFKSEGADLKVGLDSMKDKMDTELSKKERELAASPSERMEMMQDEIAATDARFDELAQEVQEKKAEVRATEEVQAAAAPATTADLPALSEMDQQATESADTSAIAEPAPPVIPARPIGTKTRTQFLDKTDVPQSDRLEEALGWVTAELVEEGMPEYGQFDHLVAVNPPDGVDTSDSALQAVVDTVVRHPLVKEGKYQGGRLLYFYATGLAPEDLHLLTASALAGGA